MKKGTILCYLLLILVTAGCNVANATVYKWRDQDGKLHFTDKPPKDAKTEEFDEKALADKVSSYKNVTIKIEPIDFGVNRQANMIVMYTTTRCGYCQKARQFFNRENIDFQERNIELSDEYNREFKRIGGKGVPVILHGNKRMNGFSEEKYRRTFVSSSD
ncbi:MAG: glutaredoxin family protein [Kangiellaceae bacterium]|nr:glutaredoxin family protein [Kangiellaceae bacterium]